MSSCSKFPIRASMPECDTRERIKRIAELNPKPRIEDLTMDQLIELKRKQFAEDFEKAVWGFNNAIKPLIIQSQTKTEPMKRYNFTITFQNCEGQTKTTSVALIATSLVAANKLFSTLYQTGCDNEAIAFGTKIRVTSVVEESILVDEVKAAKK